MRKGEGYFKQLARWISARLLLAVVRRAYPVMCIRKFPYLFVDAAKRPKFKLQH